MKRALIEFSIGYLLLTSLMLLIAPMIGAMMFAIPVIGLGFWMSRHGMWS